MTKFRSLLYRELRVTRKQILIGFGIELLLMCDLLVSLYVLLSESGESGMDTTPVIQGIFLTVTICVGLISSSACLSGSELIKSDVNTNWMNYSFALPIRPQERAAAHLCRSHLVSIVFNAFVILIDAIFCAVLNVEFSMAIIVVLVATYAFSCLTVLLEDVFLFGARTLAEFNKLHTYCVLASIALMCGLGYILIKNKKDISDYFLSSHDVYALIHTEWLLWLIPLILLLVAADYFVIVWRTKHAYSTVSIRRAAEKTVTISDTHIYPMGFFYKELKQNRLNIILTALAPLFMIGLCCIRMLMNADFLDEDIGVLHHLAFGTGFVLATSIISSIFQGDDKKLWACFVASSPDGIKRTLYNKYVLCLAMTGLYTVSAYVAETIFDTIYFQVLGEEYFSLTVLYIFAFYLLLLLTALDVPFMVRFGAKKGMFIKLGLFVVFVIVLCLIMNSLSEEASDKLYQFIWDVLHGEANDAVMLTVSILPYASLAAYYGSYKLSCKLFMKGVTAYDK